VATGGVPAIGVPSRFLWMVATRGGSNLTRCRSPHMPTIGIAATSRGGTSVVRRLSREDALVLALRTAALTAEQCGTISVGCQVVGMNAMGLWVANRVFIEPKAGASIDDVRCVRRVRHLRATGLASADRSALAHGARR